MRHHPSSRHRRERRSISAACPTSDAAGAARLHSRGQIRTQHAPHIRLGVGGDDGDGRAPLPQRKLSKITGTHGNRRIWSMSRAAMRRTPLAISGIFHIGTRKGLDDLAGLAEPQQRLGAPHP